MAFNDAYRESIQTKHISNVGFTSTAKGVTNEGYTAKNPHQVLPTQIPAVDVVGKHGALTASGVAAGLVEEHIIKFTVDPTVNGNKAWFATEDNCTTAGHSARGTIRLDQWMRHAGTQYKLRLYEDDGAGNIDLTHEILPSETQFNWEYDASAGVVYFDEDPSSNGKTIPLWGVFYTYIGEFLSDKFSTSSGVGEHTNLSGRDAINQHPASSISTFTDSFNGVLNSSNTTVQLALDTIDDHSHDDKYYTETEVDNLIVTTSGVLQIQITSNDVDITNLDTKINTVSGTLQNQIYSYDEFIELEDTPSTYATNKLLYTTASGVEFGSSYNPSTDTLTIANVNVSSGVFNLATGATVNEIVTTVVSGSTDDQLPTAKAVWDITEAAAAAVHTHYEVDGTWVSNTLWTYGTGFSALPDNLEVFVNGLKQRIGATYDLTAAVPGGVLTLTFEYNVYSDDWVSIMYTA